MRWKDEVKLGYILFTCFRVRMNWLQKNAYLGTFYAHFEMKEKETTK